jgi:hypothetical protein
MAKVWVLDTETKGTGAKVVPLDKKRKEPAAKAEPFFVAPKPRPRPPEEPEPRQPRRFKVVDVVSRRVLAEGIDARALLDVLSGIRSSVDVNISVWDREREHWRLLTLDEQHTIWARRNGAG